MDEVSRCPFCHDALSAGAVNRVECSACAAPHHAECFVESRGCAATGCETPIARVGESAVPLAVLQTIASNHDALARLALPRQERGAFRPIGLVGGVGAVLAILATGFWGGPIVAACVGLVSVVLLLAVLPHLRRDSGAQEQSAPLTGRAASDVRQQESFDPIFGAMRLGNWVPGVPLDHGEFVRERLAEQSLPSERPSDGPPTTCPHCQANLAVDEDEDDADLWYCYHCGRDLSVSPPRARAEDEDEDEEDGKGPRDAGRIKA